MDSGKSAEGIKGDTGNGISSIAKTETEGLVDTYTITFTNGDTTTFTVTNGADGTNGESAYDIAVDNGYVGTQEEWLASLVGGTGAAGVGIRNAYIDEALHLILELSDDRVIDAGYVGATIAPATHTVTFIDNDNTVLKTQTGILSGNAATAPEISAKPGLRFAGWDTAFDSVTSDLTVKATYEIEHNQLYFAFTDNEDGTTTATLSAKGDVNFYGLELYLSVDTLGMSYSSVTALTNGAMANYIGGQVRFSFTSVTGTDTEEELDLLSITFRNTSAVRSAHITIDQIDMFDEMFETETYTLAGNSYQNF